MARESSQSSGNGEPGIGHNGGGPSDAVVLAELTMIKQTWGDRAQAKKEYESFNAIYRRALQNAKARGLNADAIRDVIHDLEQDPADIKQRLVDRLRYSSLLGRPIGSQGEIFAEAEVGNPMDVGRQKVQGRKRTGPRSMEKLNPYPKGSWQAREFERGWIEGARGQA